MDARQLHELSRDRLGIHTVFTLQGNSLGVERKYLGIEGFPWSLRKASTRGTPPRSSRCKLRSSWDSGRISISAWTGATPRGQPTSSANGRARTGSGPRSRRRCAARSSAPPRSWRKWGCRSSTAPRLRTESVPLPQCRRGAGPVGPVDYRRTRPRPQLRRVAPPFPRRIHATASPEGRNTTRRPLVSNR